MTDTRLTDIRMTGVVIRILPSRGFAFVRGPDGFSRFMHSNDVTPLLDFDRMHEGSTVEFTPTEVEGGKGNKLRATKAVLR